MKSMIIQPGHALYDTFGGIHHIYANKTCMKALQSGKAFPDGAILIFDLLEVKSADNTLTEGQRKVLGVMQKDSKRFAGTGGWGFEGLDPWLLAALRNLTKPDAHMITDYVLPQAPRTLARVLAGGEILDIGSGEGFHLLHYARRYPRSQVMGLELDSAKVEPARKNIAEAFLGERVSLREGDVNQLDEGGVYDLITLNLTLHDVCSSDSCREVLGRILRALKPAWTLLVSEIAYPESIRSYRDGTFSQLLSGIELHLAMAGCEMITQRQLLRWMEEGGFENVRVATQPNPARFVVLGEKPANG